MVMIILWVITAVPALAAQCDSPKPWLVAPGRCVNQKALYIYVGIINILTDAALIVLPVYLVARIDVAGRWSIMALFSIRSVYVFFHYRKSTS
jgi:rhodopsin domain-containing protein